MFDVTVDKPKFLGDRKSTRAQIGGPSLEGDEFGRSAPVGLMHFAALRGELHKIAEHRVSGTIVVMVHDGHVTLTGHVGVGSDEEWGRLQEIGERIYDHACVVALFLDPARICTLEATYITEMKQVA